MTSSPCLVVLRGVGSFVSNCFDNETRNSQNSSLAFCGIMKRFLCKKDDYELLLGLSDDACLGHCGVVNDAANGRGWEPSGYGS